MVFQLRVRLDRARLRRGGATVAGVIVFLLAILALRRLTPPGVGGGWVDRILGELLVTGEMNAAAWFASLLLAAVSVGALLCALAERGFGDDPADRLASVGWLGVAGVFLLLSLDEFGSIHERAHGLVPWDLQAIPWIKAGMGALVIPIALVGVSLFGFGLWRLRRTPWALGAFLAGVLLFLSIPAQEGLEFSAVWADGQPRPLVLVWLEEGAELVGSLLFLAGTLMYARSRIDRRGADPGRAVLQLDLHPTRVVLASAGVLAVGGLAMLGISAAVAPFVAEETVGRRGLPGLWFPSILAAAVALLPVLLASRGPRGGGARPGPERLALVVLGLSSLGLSLYLASNLVPAGPVWTSSRLRLVIDGGLVLLAGGSVAYLVLTTARVSSRILALGGAAALVVAFAVGGDGTVFGSYVALALIALGLVGEVVRSQPVGGAPLPGPAVRGGAAGHLP